MKKLKYFLAGYAAFAVFAYALSAYQTMASSSAEKTNLSALEERAQSAISVFQNALKSELMAAMQKGGPKAAVEICNEKAPQIAEKVNLDNGVIISRTSLKVRNPDNEPSEWEKTVLEDFEKRKSGGEAIQDMISYKNEDNVYTYMKPIPMMGMCASCHGSHVPQPLYKDIKKFYPNDKAIGFEPGDIRGAFVVEINLNGHGNE